MYTSYHLETIARQRTEQTARQARSAHQCREIKPRTGWHVPDGSFRGARRRVGTASSFHRSPATFVVVAVAAVALTGALATGPHDAHASPEADGNATVGVGVVHPSGDDVERPCFIEPPSWNEALDGTLPRCHTYLR